MAKKNGFSGLTKAWDTLAREAVSEAQDEVIVAFAEKVTEPTGQEVRGGNTPVAEGVLMANTRIAYGSPDKGFNASLTDPSGRETAKKLMRESNADVFLPIYITNNTPYNVQAEHSGWQRTEAYKYFSTAVQSSIEALNRYGG